MTDSSSSVVRASQSLSQPLPTEDTDEATLPGADQGYVVVTEDASTDGQEYVVSVAVSLEEVDDSTSALVPLLLVGVPLVLLVVGGTTWMVATRALAPVERIRREVEQITGDRLDRRVPEPSSRDEIHRLALTMNQMLGRLQDSRDRQQQFVADASHELRSPLATSARRPRSRAPIRVPCPRASWRTPCSRSQRGCNVSSNSCSCSPGPTRGRSCAPSMTSISTTWRWPRRAGCAATGSTSTRPV